MVPSCLYPTTVKMHLSAKNILFTLIALCLLWHSNANAIDSIIPDKIAVLSSKEIRPYIEAIEGLSGELIDSGLTEIDVFDLQKYSGKAESALKGQLSENGYGFCIAVGPEAAQFAVNQTLPFIYTMISYPENISGPNAPACGISFNIPLKEQLDAIKRTLPEVHSVGLLFDRQYNDKFYAGALEIAVEIGIEIIPMEVVSKRDIPKVLKRSWEKIDVLWFIPDETVISESVIEYINKEALVNRVPTVGFNRFFYESGSLLSFVFDYRTLGQQTAHLALTLHSERSCISESPQYSLWINERVMNRLGVHVESNSEEMKNSKP